MSEPPMPSAFRRMPAKMTFHRWIASSSAIGEGEAVVIVSPYLGNALVHIVRRLQEHGCASIRIFTLFNLQVFADGSSNFKAVKEVFEQPGCHFFHVENLHAKFILFGERSAIFGSQNVTKTRNFNLEFNCQTTDADFLRGMRQTAAEIDSIAQPVTKGWFQLVETFLEEVGDQFERAVQVCDEKEKEIRDENALVADLEKKAENLRLVRKSLSELETKTTWHRSEGSQDGIILKKKIGPGGKWQLVLQDSWTPRSLLNWGPGANFDEQSCERFFCLFHFSHGSIPLIGCARMTKTRVSFISSGFHSKPLKFPEVLSPDKEWMLAISTLYPSETNSSNLQIVLKEGSSFVKFDSIFLGHQLILNSPVQSSGDGDLLKKRIEENQAVFARCLIEAVMDPFKPFDGIRIPDRDTFHGILARTRLETWTLRLGTPQAFSKAYFFRFQAHTPFHSSYSL
jgi:PLD-like domain